MKTYLFSHLDQIMDTVNGREIAMFLDFDGTLAPIVGRPEDAALPDGMRDIILQLGQHVRIGVVSGREVGDVRSRVGVGGIIYAGNHGLQIEGEGISFSLPELKEARRELEGLMRELAKDAAFSHGEGGIMEDKGLTISLHYRLFKGDHEGFVRRMRSAIEPYVNRGIFRVVEGKKVVEVRPSLAWDKGKAVGWLLEQEMFQNTFPLYIGDDETDRDAFRTLKGRGISVAVGLQLEDADFYLRTQEEVAEFLERLIESLRMRTQA